MYQLIFTQKVDGSFINHQSIEIPVSNFKIKHEFKCDKNYQEYLKVSKECEDRVIKFKKEQAEIAKLKLNELNTQLNQIKTAKKVVNLAISNLFELQLND